MHANLGMKTRRMFVRRIMRCLFLSALFCSCFGASAGMLSDEACDKAKDRLKLEANRLKSQAQDLANCAAKEDERKDCKLQFEKAREAYSYYESAFNLEFAKCGSPNQKFRLYQHDE
jgi:hypothetical protein